MDDKKVEDIQNDELYKQQKADEFFDYLLKERHALPRFQSLSGKETKPQFVVLFRGERVAMPNGTSIWTGIGAAKNAVGNAFGNSRFEHHFTSTTGFFRKNVKDGWVHEGRNTAHNPKWGGITKEHLRDARKRWIEKNFEFISYVEWLERIRNEKK